MVLIPSSHTKELHQTLKAIENYHRQKTLKNLEHIEHTIFKTALEYRSDFMGKLGDQR